MWLERAIILDENGHSPGTRERRLATSIDVSVVWFRIFSARCGSAC
ncbi:MAG TPA: hypothetical protein VGM39_16300 [Kofleriaceae bacterium]